MNIMIDEELRKINNLSYKWKIDKEYSHFSRFYEMDSNNDNMWNNNVSYWLKLFKKIPEMENRASEIADNNMYANSAVAYLLMGDKSTSSSLIEVKKYVDRAVIYGDSQLVYDYAIELLKQDDSLGNNYIETAAKLGNRNAQKMLSYHYENQDSEDMFLDYKIKPAPYSQELEITGMGYLLDQLGQEYANPISIPFLQNVSVRQVERCLRRICADFNVPVSVSASSLVSGGFLNTINAKLSYNDASKGGGLLNKKVYRALRVEHPNPPQKYCEELIVFLPDGVKFFFIGGSRAFKEMNEYEKLKDGDFDNVGLFAKMRFFTGGTPDEEEYLNELRWHMSVYELFQKLLS